MKYKAYISNHTIEEERIRIGIRIYDSDEPTQKTIIDELTNEPVIVARTEYQETIYIPYNQSEEYIKSKIKECLEKFKTRMSDSQKMETIKNKNEQIE